MRKDSSLNFLEVRMGRPDDPETPATLPFELHPVIGLSADGEFLETGERSLAKLFYCGYVVKVESPYERSAEACGGRLGVTHANVSPQALPAHMLFDHPEMHCPGGQPNPRR
jgi:hypothetical protein